MKYEQYMAKRNGLMNEAKAAMEAGNLEKFNELKGKIEALDNEYEAAQTAQANYQALEGGAIVPPGLQNFATAHAAQAGGTAATENILESAEYSQAFMNFACRGTPIPDKFKNVNQTTTTSDAGAVIPKTIVREIIRKMTVSGYIFRSVRHLNVKGGVSFPILELKPKATWITEAKSSDDQKIQANTSVSFSYFGLECKIARSILVNVVTIEEFKELFVQLATEAIIVELEKSIFVGTGVNQALGVCNDERVTNKITPTAEEFSSWQGWKKITAKIPKGYRGGTWYMAQGTWDTYIDGMVDKNGQPVARVNYGIEDGTQYRFGGRPVETVEDDVIAPYDLAEPAAPVAVYMKPTDYCINSNMEMTVVEWTDQDTNKKKTKVMVICDGKILDPNGVLIVLKHA